MNHARTIRPLIGVVLLACPAAVHAQLDSVALEQRELADLRVVLERAATKSGLDKLSGTGKKVLQDVSNVVAVVNDGGLWRYRHVGNNIELVPKTGDASDRQTIEKAMQSASYMWLSGLSSSTRGRSLTAVLTGRDGQRQVAGYLSAALRSDDLPLAIKEAIAVRIGESITGLPGAVKGQLLQKSEGSQVYQLALAQAVQLEDQRLKSMAGETLSIDPEAGALFATCDDYDGEVPTPQIDLAGWTESKIDGGRILTRELAPHVKGYWVIDTKVKDDPTRIMDSGKWNALIRSGDIKAYIGNLHDGRVFGLPPGAVVIQ